MATLKDVAARAGVSIATVSYCINNTHSLTPETRQRIQQAIADLNYIPNSQARNLKSQISKDLCVILPDLDNLCYNEFLKGMLLVAEEASYSLNIACTYNNVSKEQTLIENAISNKYAGIMLVTCQPQNTTFFQDTLIKHKIETVFLDRLPQNLDVIYFGFDNYNTIRFLTQRLLTANYQEILLMTGPNYLFSEAECIAGFEEAMDNVTPGYARECIFTTDTTKEGSFKVSLQTWIGNPPQAIITTSQSICQGVIEACNLACLHIPEDICIITLDVDNWNRSSFYPNIIRTNRPAYSLGMQSCQALIKAIEKSEMPENRFHLFKDAITEYPLHLPMPRNLNIEHSDLSLGSLNIACTDLPTMKAIKAVSLDFSKKYHLTLHFTVFTLRELFQEILEDSHREHPLYDIYLYDTSWFSYLQKTGCLMDLTSTIYGMPDMHRYFVEKNLDNCSVDGHIFGFPVVGGTQFLLYRKDLFTDPELCQAYKKNHHISLRPPKTWKEFNTIARFFTKKYNPQSPTDYGTSIPSVLNEELILEFEPRLWSHGGSFFDTHGHLCMNTPQNARALANFMEAFHYTKHDTATGLNVFEHFAKGELAMCLCYTEYAAQIQNSAHAEYLHRCGYSMLPGATPVNVGWHLGVSPNCRKMEYVMRFFHWLHQRHNSYYMSILSGASALEYPYKNHELKKLYPWIELTADALETCRSRIYPLKKLNGYLPPYQFERVICDALRTYPQTPEEISHCLDTMQQNILKELTT